MRYAVLTALVLAAASLPVRAQAPEPCRTEIALRMLERAMQARDDFFLWEELDDREASAELDRYLIRLDSLLTFVTRCAPVEPGVGMLEIHVRATLRQAKHIAEARRARAQLEARSK